ncbi:Glutamate synthase [NADPH] large chain [compost metagenome]
MKSKLFNRYTPLCLSAAALATTGVGAAFGDLSVGWTLLPLAATGLGVRDLLQDRHSILRNYPLLGHLRYAFESIRTEMRQYFIEGDDEERPFSRAQRSLVYQRAKGEQDAVAFGTKKAVREVGHEWLGHSMTPSRIASHDFRVLVGAERAKPYEMSIFNISAMSFGALSANAIRALNSGAKRGGFAHDTGEGSLSKYHREHGGDIIWEIGSGYFGCRKPDGSFDPVAFAEVAGEAQVKMIELKLSQGAKPGHGGVLPGPKVTPEIAEARRVPVGQDCISPANHSEFSTPVELLHFIDRLRNLSGGKPTGFKLCVGHPWEFMGIAKAMLETGIVPDFIVVDGAEGGTGAAPLEFADNMGAPLQEGLLLVHNTLVGIGLRDRIKIGASGKIVTAFDIARTMALGADWVNSARGFMFAVGCIQAQTCHTGRCPTGVATQDADRQRALVVPDKAERVYNFHRNTLEALKELLQAAGLQTPAQLGPRHIVRRVASDRVEVLGNLLDFLDTGDLVEGRLRFPVFETFWPLASSQSFSLAEGDAAPRASAPRPVFWMRQDGSTGSAPTK